MNLNYSFLQDEKALQEIRKHKWIESEKNGREIGFATAALDWIHAYGAQWLKNKIVLSDRRDYFKNKKSYNGPERRFSLIKNN